MFDFLIVAGCWWWLLGVIAVVDSIREDMGEKDILTFQELCEYVFVGALISLLGAVAFYWRYKTKVIWKRKK